MALYLDRASGTYEYCVYSSRNSTSAIALPRSFSSPTRAPSMKLSLLAGATQWRHGHRRGSPRGWDLIFSIPARRNFADHRAPLCQRAARGPLSNNFSPETVGVRAACRVSVLSGGHVSFGHHSNLSAAWTLASAQRTKNSAVNFAYRIRAPRNSITEHSVALVTGGAVLGFDDQVHIDLDRPHTVLSPHEARQFAAELNRIADVIDRLPDRERGE